MIRQLLTLQLAIWPGLAFGYDLCSQTEVIPGHAESYVQPIKTISLDGDSQVSVSHPSIDFSQRGNFNEGVLSH